MRCAASSQPRLRKLAAEVADVGELYRIRGGYELVLDDGTVVAVRTAAAVRDAARRGRARAGERGLTLTVEEWQLLGRALFGDDVNEWRAVCPCCLHVASVGAYRQAGAPEGGIFFSCIGRWLEEASEAFTGKPGPCTYAGGGLFGLNPWKVGERATFAFACGRCRQRPALKRHDWRCAECAAAGEGGLS